MYTKMQYFGEREQQIRNRIHHPVDFNAQYAGRNKVRIVEQEGRGPYARPDPDHPVDAVIMESDPLAYYPLDWGNVGLDYSGNDFHGDVVGTFNRIVRQTGTREMRMSAADPGAGISLPVPGLGKGPMSIEFLYDGTDITNLVILERGWRGGAEENANANLSFQTSGVTKLLRVNQASANVAVFPDTPLTQPIHVVATVSATNMFTIYANGVKTSSRQAQPQAAPNADLPWSLFGRRSGPGSPFIYELQGAMACLAFYNRELTAEEAENHHRVIFGGDFRSA